MAQQAASRAGSKLAAGLAHFGLQASVRGARAVDVGASTGGFTEVLLQQGAAHVTAVDVGQGQLHGRLQADARVASHEQTDWKTLSLHQLPGPFDFFTVDVSFVAARSMLRSLAFRLRSGAQGIVLVKPQFELPRRPLAELARPQVRARALELFSTRAVSLGFQVLGHLDSPVAGREGTVEMLVHLRFAARSARLPAFRGEGAADATAVAAAAVGATAARLRGEGPPVAAAAVGATAARLPSPRGLPRGEGKGEGPPAAKPDGRGAARTRQAATRALVGDQRWFAVVVPGLEEVARAEVARLPGVRAVQVVPGGVEFGGPLAVGLAANLWLRVATRVVLRLGTVRAREFAKLRRLLGKLDFAPVVPSDRPLRLAVSATRSRLYHTKAIAETVALAVGDRLDRKMALAAPAAAHEEEDSEGAPAAAAEGGPAEAPATRVLVRGEGDVWTVSVDSSGELLHRRGWRREAGRAPLRETLAAGVLALAGHDPERPLVDAMTGSGTFALEAAAIACGRAPGLGRAFAFEAWSPPDVSLLWERARTQAVATVRPAPPAPILGWDRDAAVLARAARNAERAGLAAAVTFERRDLGQWRPPAGSPPGLVVINPPYGRRLSNAGAARALLRSMGLTLRSHFPGWRAAILLADARWSPLLGLGTATLHPLLNGGLRVHLAIVQVPG
jgi:putative N6-adenine-specific DNA methylase